RQEPHQERLRRAGNTLQQRVAAGEERHQHFIDDGVLANDAGRDGGAHGAHPFGNLLGGHHGVIALSMWSMALPTATQSAAGSCSANARCSTATSGPVTGTRCVSIVRYPSSGSEPAPNGWRRRSPRSRRLVANRVA